MSVVDANWRIDVDVLQEGPEAENAAKYWSCRPNARGKIAWDQMISHLFGTVDPRKAAEIAAAYTTATLNRSCTSCGTAQEGVVVASRLVASAKLSSLRFGLCQSCKDAESSADAAHRARVEGWMEMFTGSLPDELETLDEILLLDKLAQSGPFKDRRMPGVFLKDEGLTKHEIGQLFDLGIIRPAGTTMPGSIEFHEGSTSYAPFDIHWHPAGDGTIPERFESVENLASAELHGALRRFSEEIHSRCKEAIVLEAEKYLVRQLADRRFDKPTDSQMVRFRESVGAAWTDLSLGILYQAIYRGCARAADNKAQVPVMGRAAVTGAAVNAVLDALPKYQLGQWSTDKPFGEDRRWPLSSQTVTIFRTMLDLNPMSAVEEDVTAVLGIEARPLPAPQEVLDGARNVYVTCLRSMPEENAFMAAIASLDLLTPYYDVDTINAARAAFAGERAASRFSDSG